MHQSGRLKGLPGLFLEELLRCEFAQFVIHQRQKLRGGMRIALLNGREDARDFVHED